MAPDAGIRFGHYLLVRRLARGGMAEVFLAQQQGLEGFDRRVAVKRILPHLADSPDFVKMFLGEAKLAAQLSHPNVVHIYEFGKVERDYFIAMEFIDGVHAGQLFEQRGPGRLPATLVARIGADAANALHYAHELRGVDGKPHGLVHRDVSPANIMISYDGVVKLCDFGIAKAATASDHLTSPGQVKGKYAYMSPEQTIAAPLDGRSDVFSLAIVLWELLSGAYIVPRGDAVAAMRAIRYGTLEPLEKVAPDTPPPLARAIGWALEPDRERRATAAELAQALEAFIKSSPELATAMQLGAWVRARFPRDPAGLPGSGGPGTQAGPGTTASPAPATADAGSGGTPPGPAPRADAPLSPARAARLRRVVRLIADSSESEIYSTSDLQDEPTHKGPRPPVETPSSPTAVVARAGHPADLERTVRAPSGRPLLDGPRADADEESTARTPPGRPATAAPRGDGLDGDDAGASRPPSRRPSRPDHGGEPSPDDETTTRAPSESPSSERQRAIAAADQERTVPAPPVAFSERTERVPPGHLPGAVDEEDGHHSVLETAVLDRRSPIPSGPAAVPTRVEPPLARTIVPPMQPIVPVGPEPPSAPFVRASQSPVGGVRAQPAGASSSHDEPPRPSSQHDAWPAAAYRAPDGPAALRGLRRRRTLVVAAALAGLTVVSFVIALAAAGKRRPAAAAHDAAALEDLTDAAALPLAPPPADASPDLAGSGDARDAAGSPQTMLIVRTVPAGGTIRVGEQTQRASLVPDDPTGVASARLALEPGRHTVTAELAGYQAEIREVRLERGAPQTLEIEFTRKPPARADRSAPSGRLSVRTTPWSDVLLAGKKIGRAPFTDLVLPAGTHTLTFKNPVRASVTRTVTIRAGKLTRLNFSLP